MMQPLMQPANTSMGIFLDPGELPPKPVFKSVVSIHFNWLVVLTILKNISQWERLSHILWKITNVPNHQPVEAFPNRFFVFVYHCTKIFMLGCGARHVPNIPMNTKWCPKSRNFAWSMMIIIHHNSLWLHELYNETN